MDKYLKLRDINGLSNSWLHDVKVILRNYLKFVGWTIDEDKTLEHLKQLQVKYSTTSYRKRVYQIRKFLSFLKVDWANDIKPPSEPNTIPKRVIKDDINQTLSHFEGNQFFKQIKAIIMLSATSGIRAEELYQLDVKDIDSENRILHINHNPDNGQTTKTKISRVSFFNDEAKQSIEDYLQFYNYHNKLTCLFNKSHISRIFKDAPIRVKDLRKFFSQEWDRRGGPTSIKKILMGHSLKGDVDLMHYNYQSEEDLKQIYDKVMG